MASFTQEVKQALLAALSNNLMLLGPEPCLAQMFFFMDREGGRQARSCIALMYSIGMISRAELSQAVKSAILHHGSHVYYQQVKKANLRPGHVTSPEALASALARPPLNRLARRVKFDHDETLEQFLRRADGLVEQVVKKLTALPNSLRAELEQAVGGAT